MFKIRKILVPVDFSPCSRAALEHALALSRAVGASVHALHVWKPEEGNGHLVDTAEAALTAEAARLRTFLAEVATGFEGELQHRVEIGDPERLIVEDARAGHYDLIAIGTHGSRARSRIATGSVAATVVRTAGCPVLTVHESE
jgi:universal stress protein A